MNLKKLIIGALAIVAISACKQESNEVKGELFSYPDGTQSRWVSFENQYGEKGKGGLENKGGKGHAFDRIEAGESKVMFDVKGPGTIHRMWFTIMDRSPEMLRGMRIDMYWDGAEKPAVSAPFGDFFGIDLGKQVAHEEVFFSDPEARSFNASIPMPFNKSAKIVVTNETKKEQRMIFYDIDYTISPKPFDKILYFHTHWNRVHRTEIGKDFEILPKVEGTGRFIGSHIGVITNPDYEDSWWGEGEVKMYLDGDGETPTMVGSGTEDYIGTAWGQGRYNHRYQGCLIGEPEEGRWSFYRYHIKDPIYFYSDFKATIQALGGFPPDRVQSFIDKGAELKIVSVQKDLEAANKFASMLDNPELKLADITDKDLRAGWANFYRRDDYSATAYFYLDKPESNLPVLAEVEKRTENLEGNKKIEQTDQEIGL
ncbi:MAG: glycoside hydrolase family 172 protein [Bacteroidota bacterium]